MRGITHLFIGGAAGCGVAWLAGTPRAEFPAAYIVGAAVATLPNLDRLARPGLRTRSEGTLARFARALGGASGEGRELTHSLWALVTVVVATPLARLLGAPAYAAWAAIGGYLSHILADMWTLWGVRLMAPWGDRVVVPPWSSLRPLRGGVGEVILLLAAGFCGITVLASWAVPRLVPVWEALLR